MVSCFDMDFAQHSLRVLDDASAGGHFAVWIGNAFGAENSSVHCNFAWSSGS